MMNKKLLKKIAATVMCSSMALSAFGLAACQPDGGGNGGGHKHNYTWEADSNGTTHHGHCSVDGCDNPDITGENHTWEGDKCVKCKADKPSGESNAIVPEYKGEAAGPVAGEQDINSLFKASELDKGNLAEAWTNGIISLPKGTELRDRKDTSNKYTRSIKNGAITIKVPAAGTLKISFASGSSGGGAKYRLTKPGSDPEEVLITTGDKVLNDLVIEATAGTYLFEKANGTVDVFAIELDYRMSTTPIKSIAVTDAGKADYLLTQKLDCSNVALVAKDANDVPSEIKLENCKFDVSKYNPAVSGEYEIGVTYYLDSNLDSEIKEFKTSYKVKVYAVSSIKLDTTLTSNEKQTTVKQAYLPNATLDTTGLTVTATGTLGASQATFAMKPADYTVFADLTTEGEKDVTVAVSAAFTGAEAVTQTYKVVVKAKKDVTANEVSVTVGESGEFKTVTQALCYLETCGYADGVVKTVNIGDGEYYEKISVNMPNVHFVGSATNKPSHTVDNGVVLWYDGANGLADPAGTPYGTKGSSSVTVTAKATGFRAENITFKNYYNTAELYYALKAKTGGTQGVALMVEADGAVFTNCKMTGYQDTLYANKGKQFYYNCFIEGRTDYIFGADAIPYFYKCTIFTVNAINGAQNKNGDGGYIVAYQNTTVAYGPVFNGCNITGDDAFTVEGVEPNTTNKPGVSDIALGRAWGKECHMVIMNSEISAHYSTAAHTAGTQKGQRYVTMSGNEPKPANMVEYNNTGDGAIQASIANTCTVITAAEAATMDKYQIANVATLLGFNPNVTFEPEA